MKKGDIKRGREGSQGKSGLEKEERLERNNFATGRFQFKLYLEEFKKRKNQG